MPARLAACSKCGASTVAELKRCLDRPRPDCPWEPVPGRRRSHPVLGLGLFAMGVSIAAAISAVLFVSPPAVSGVVEMLIQAAAMVGALTFVYGVTGLFAGLGLTMLLYREVDLEDREEGRLLRAGSMLGRSLALQVADLGAPVAIAEPTDRPAALPASVAALRLAAEDVPDQRPAAPLARRMKRFGDAAHGMVTACLESALLDLLDRDAIRARPARVRVDWPFLSRSPAFERETYLLEPGPNPTPGGALEAELLEQVRTWAESGRGDYPLPTVRELVSTFEDSDGDFSAHRILRTVEEEGMEGGWFRERPRLSTKRLLPEPSDTPPDTTRAATGEWSRLRDELRGREPALTREIRNEIARALRSGDAPPTDLERAQGRLRRKVFGTLLAGSAALASVVYLAALLL